MEDNRLGTIAFVIDERLSRQKSAILTRIVNSLRQFAKIELIGGNVTEDELLKRLEIQQFDLVLAPWYRYLSWSKIEGFYGLSRTSGPTFAGYFCDAILPYELGDQADHLRAILLDFANLDTNAIKVVVKALLLDSTRSGILPFLGPTTPIYCESWFGGAGLGSRIDSVLGLPEISGTEWARRANAFRICLTALWSLIYEEGPGKGELTAATQRSPRAFFQVAAAANCFAMRLCYSMPTWSPRDALKAFWPTPSEPLSPAQILLRYADLVRVHVIPEPSDIELTLIFFPVAPAQKAFSSAHTLWVEPLTANLVKEMPFEAPPGSQLQNLGVKDPQGNLKALPRTVSEARPASIDGSSAEAAKTRRFILEAAAKIRELKTQLAEAEETISELRSGGIGTARPTPPPDVDSLLDAFHERYAEARFRAQLLEEQIAKSERDGAPSSEIDHLRSKLSQMAKVEQGWIKKIAATLELYRETRKRAAG